MFYIPNKIYEEIASEIMQQVTGSSELVCGVVELSYGRYELIFGFDYCDDVLRRWIMIPFEDGHRCSSDFNVEQLQRWL